MKLEIFKSLWGMSGVLDRDLGQIRDAGYDGFEFDLPDLDDAAPFRTSRERHGLKYFTLIRTEGPDHLASFSRQLEEAARLDADLVSSSSAMDWMSNDQRSRFFEGALRVQERFDFPVAHETHRQTALYTPWHTADLIAEFPELRITADYSHWCCVAERMLNDQDANIAACNDRAVHIHGRVGYPGGPQVGDPRAPENLEYVVRHEEWWRDIVRARLRDAAGAVTFDPEYGPPPMYMPAVPFAQQPVADLWDVCLWAADRFRVLYAEVLAEEPFSGALATDS